MPDKFSAKLKFTHAVSLEFTQRSRKRAYRGAQAPSRVHFGAFAEMPRLTKSVIGDTRALLKLADMKFVGRLEFRFSNGRNARSSTR